MPTLKTIAELREAARDCKACDLYKTATQTVFGEGPAKAQIMFVGEQPGIKRIAQDILLLDQRERSSMRRWNKQESNTRKST